MVGGLVFPKMGGNAQIHGKEHGLDHFSIETHGILRAFILRNLAVFDK